MTKIFLTTVGLAYLSLSAWCVMQPHSTARSVGFELTPGSGESEYLVVYGGLQFALGVVFVRVLGRRSEPVKLLEMCVIVHASLVAFRTWGFVVFEGFGNTTLVLAAVEWLILIVATLLYLRDRRLPQTAEAAA